MNCFKIIHEFWAFCTIHCIKLIETNWTYFTWCYIFIRIKFKKRCVKQPALCSLSWPAVQKQVKKMSSIPDQRWHTKKFQKKLNRARFKEIISLARHATHHVNPASSPYLGAQSPKGARNQIGAQRLKTLQLLKTLLTCQTQATTSGKNSPLMQMGIRTFRASLSYSFTTSTLR